MVTDGRILMENNPAPAPKDPVRTGDMHHAIKAMLASPLQELSRPLAGHGGITPLSTSNLFSYSSSAPNKEMKRASTSQFDQTTFARFDRLSRASPSPKWMTCSKIPHRETEQSVMAASPPTLGQQSSCLPSPTSENGSRGADVLQSTFSSRINSASIELKEMNAAVTKGNNEGRTTIVISSAPQFSLNPADLQGSGALTDKGDDDTRVIKKKSGGMAEVVERGEGVALQVVDELEEIEEKKQQERDSSRAVEASNSGSTETGRGNSNSSTVAVQPPEDTEGNDVELQKQDGVAVGANSSSILDGQNVETDQSGREDAIKEKKSSKDIITVAVDQTAAEGMDEPRNDSTCFKNGVEQPSSSTTALERNAQNAQNVERSELNSSSDDSKQRKEIEQQPEDGNTCDVTSSSTPLDDDEEEEFLTATEIRSQESSSPAADGRIVLRSSAIPPRAALLSVQHPAQKKTVLQEQHGLGKVILSANRGEVVLRDWFVIAAGVSNENKKRPSSTKEPVLSSGRKEEVKYHLCGNLETYQSNRSSHLPPVTSGVIVSRQRYNLILTEDGDVYRLEGECCSTAIEGEDSNQKCWTSSACEAFRMGFPLYWRSALRKLLKHDADEMKGGEKHEKRKPSSTEDVMEGTRQNMREVKDRTVEKQRDRGSPQNQSQDAANAADIQIKLRPALVALDEEEDKKKQQISIRRKLRPRLPPPKQKGGRQLKRKLETPKPTPRNVNPTEQKKMKIKKQKKSKSVSHLSKPHITSGSSLALPVVEQKKQQQLRLRSSPHLDCTSRFPPPAARRSLPSRIPIQKTSSHSNIIKGGLVTKQGPPRTPSMARKVKKKRTQAPKRQKQSNPNPHVKVKTERTQAPKRKKQSNSNPHVKVKKSRPASTTPTEDSVQKKTRSGRHIFSSLEWWKGERLMSTRPGLQHPPVVVGRGEIREGGGVNSSSEKLNNSALILKKKKNIDGDVNKGRGSRNKATTTTMRVGSATKAATGSKSSKQPRKNAMVSSSQPKRKKHNDKKSKIKSAAATPRAGMKMARQKKKQPSVSKQEGGTRQMKPDHPPDSG